MLEIALDVDEEWDSSRSWHELVRKAAEAAIAESAFPQLATSAGRNEISVSLSSDEQVRALNHEWRGKDNPTNVLSFPMLEKADLQRASIAGREALLGDMILARGVCQSEAAEMGVSIEDHTRHLLVHGTLHLLGCDHQAEADAEDMEAREIRALARLGIADPYRVTR